MFISDKDALQYASKLILILVPFFSSLFSTWSWIIEILLLFAVFIHSRGYGLKTTVILLTAGYLAAVIPTGGNGLSQIGFTPWAGIVLLGLKARGFDTAHGIFWGLTAAALLSALPVVPVVRELLRPEVMEESIKSVLQYYEQQGMFQALEKQGINAAEFEKYLKLAMPVYYKLMPALAGIIGMLELGIAYFVYRFSLKRSQKIRPFALLRLPWYSVWFAISGLAAYLGGGYLASNFLEIVGLNIMAGMAALSLLLGFSCLAYLIRHPKMPRLLVWMTILAGLFFPYFLLGGLIFVGLFDPVLNLRRIPEKKEGGKQ